MPAPNPQVQVFHFTSRISSAKIRKYKLATERGMASGSVPTRTPTPTSNITQTRPSPSLEPQPQEHPIVVERPSMEPPAKKPRLKLRVRPSSQNQGQDHDRSPDNITVSHPRRDSSLRIHYDENMSLDGSDTDASSIQQKPRASPAASSDLSSVSSNALREPTPVKEATRPSSKPRDYGRDFMSYYVTGGDEEDDVVEEVPPKASPSKPGPTKRAPAVQAPAAQEPSAQETQFRHHQGPPAYPTTVAKALPPRPNPPHPPQPIVILADPPRRTLGPRKPETVGVMIKKIEVLSAALTTFGGVSPVPRSPHADGMDGDYLSAPTSMNSIDFLIAPEPAAKPQSKAGFKSKSPTPKEDAEVDDFLAMFDDEDSDNRDDQEGNQKSTDDKVEYTLQSPGQPDRPLVYGIQFIQNALQSWAKQRITAQATQEFQREYMRRSHSDSHSKRGPGRPRKFDEEVHFMPAAPPVIRVDVAKTPEGDAVAAFQEVLDSGCLQVNAVLPFELTRALRHLYMQIDHLINQGARNDPPWQCMSYGAQIAANKIRVEKWKEAHAKAQEEMARQQHLAQQQVMQQMGIQPPRSVMTAEQASHQHAVELERRRSAQHAAQQPQLSRYLTNPLSFENQPAAGPSRTAPPPSPINGTSAGSPTIGATVASVGEATGVQSQQAPSDGKGVHLDKIKLYMPNFLPRSGQSMKFSFAPNSELALKAFGAQAFPTNNNHSSSLPNRGPMSATPLNHSSPIIGHRPSSANGPKPGSASNATTPTVQIQGRSTSVTNDVIMIDGEDSGSRALNKGGKSVTSNVNGTATTNEDSSDNAQFVAMDISGPKHRSSSLSTVPPNVASSPTPRSPAEIPNGIHTSPLLKKDANAIKELAGNAKTSNLASRFPFPGAVIVDK